MAEPTSYKGRFEEAGDLQSVTVYFDVPVSGNYPALRFPSKGRVVGAYLVADVAASGTNVIFAGLRNGGVTGVGTIQTAPQAGGTVLAGSAYTMAVATDGKEQFEAGEWALLNITTQNAITDISVQIDYRVEAF